MTTAESSDVAAPILEMFARLSARRFDSIGELLTDDAVFDVPYGRMRVEGRDAFVYSFSRVTAKLFDPFRFRVDSVYPVSDGETVIVEYSSEGTVVRNGNPYANAYVGVFRIRSGLIAMWREYFNPVVFNEAAGDVVDAVLAEAAGD